MGRKSISKKVRFEVFKRDKFTCQYCGRIAPDVVLNVDHIEPVASGGTNDLCNLVTSCFDCNSGKRHRKLDDDTVVKVQHAAISAIDERRVQLEMMKEWRDECVRVADEECRMIEDIFAHVFNCKITDSGRNKIKACIKKYGFSEVLDSTEIACSTYESAEAAFDKLSGILRNRDLERKDPISAKTSHIIAILNKRQLYCSPFEVRDLVTSYMESNCPFDELLRFARTSRNWTCFCGDSIESLNTFNNGSRD